MKKIKLNLEREKKTKVIWFRIPKDEYVKIQKIALKEKVKISTLMRAFTKELLKRI